MSDKFEGVKLDGLSISYKRETQPVVGVEARIETSGDIERRITATRLLATGPFALALPRKRTIGRYT